MEYTAVHPTKYGPLFTFQNRKFLTRRDINKALKMHLNLPTVSSHSFRIGAATTAAITGHWTSDSFRAYIRIPNSTILVSISIVDVASYHRTFDSDVV